MNFITILDLNQFHNINQVKWVRCVDEYLKSKVLDD